MSKRQNIEEQIGRLLGQLVSLSKYPEEDPCQDGDVIWFEKNFNGEIYYYAAIRANKGEWYTTAVSSPNWFGNWSALCEWMGTRVDKVYLMQRASEPFIDGKAAKKEFTAEMRRQLYYDGE